MTEVGIPKISSQQSACAYLARATVNDFPAFT
jgi:hypothetical protein